MKRTVIKRMKVLGGMMYIHVAYTVYVLVGGIFERKRGKERERDLKRVVAQWRKPFFTRCAYLCFIGEVREREKVMQR